MKHVDTALRQALEFSPARQSAAQKCAGVATFDAVYSHNPTSGTVDNKRK